MSKFKVIQLLPELNIGGVERGTKDFSKVLVERGHDSLVISNGGIFEKDIIEDGGKHINLPIHKKSLFSIRYASDLRDIYLSEKPDIEIAAATAEGPGIGKILISLSIHSLTNIEPGSEILGVPASDIKEIIFPDFKYSIIFIRFFFSLNLWFEINFDFI